MGCSQGTHTLAGNHACTLQQDEEQQKQKKENQKNQKPWCKDKLGFVCILHVNPKTLGEARLKKAKVGYHVGG